MGEFERALQFIRSHRWQEASTMKHIPHAYTINTWCKDINEFNWFDGFIHREGEVGRFGSKIYKYLYLNGYKYWDCGDQNTIENLINRDVYPRNFKDTALEESFDLFAQQYAKEEDDEVMEILHSSTYDKVLNPFCSTGRAYDILKQLDDKNVKWYVGMDSRISHLRRFKEQKNPYRLYHDLVGHFYFGQMGLVFTLEAEKLNSYALRRIRHMVSEGGLALLFTKERLNLSLVDRYRISGNWKQTALKHWNLITPTI